MPLRLLFAMALGLTLLSAPAAADLPMTRDEFKMWKEYQDALDDPRVQKLPESKKLLAIARNFRVPERKLRLVVEKGEAHGADIVRQSEEAIRAALAGTEPGARLKEVRVDASAAHVIGYVQWLLDKPETIDREVCLVAARAAKAAPIAATFKVWVTEPGNDKGSAFEGLIGHEAAGRIKEERIVDFATTRYIKLFEKVKRTL